MPILPNALAKITRASDNDNAVLSLPLSKAAFSFDSFGVAGFFGGDSSVAAMATANLIPARRWVGWYNNPGSYEIAKQYGPLGNLRVCDGLFPDGEHDPARLFKLDGTKGPPFIAMHSGTNFAHTSHLAHLITGMAEDKHLTHPAFPGARTTTCPSVTIVKLKHIPGKSEHPPLPQSYTAFISILPILMSVGGCILCALVGDWFCFASIAVGILAHGIACCVIGSGQLTFQHPTPSPDAPPGDGVLKGDHALVILLGDEGAVNTFIRGRFHLQYGANGASDKGREAQVEHDGHGHRPNRPSSGAEGMSMVEKPLQGVDPPSTDTVQGYNSHPVEAVQADGPQPTMKTDPVDYPLPSPSKSWIPSQSLIGYCSLLLIVQFLGQLLLIPLGTLFGQLMFIATVIASWMYNTHLSSINREKIQTQILFDVLELKDADIQKYQLSTWTATVAFTAFVLAMEHPVDDPMHVLDAMIPNKTVVWGAWKKNMSEKLKDRGYFDAEGERKELKFSEKDWEITTDDGKYLDGKHVRLLKTIFHDTEDAWAAWLKVRNSLI